MYSRCPVDVSQQIAYADWPACLLKLTNYMRDSSFCLIRLAREVECDALLASYLFRNELLQFGFDIGNHAFGLCAFLSNQLLDLLELSVVVSFSQNLDGAWICNEVFQ